MSVVARHLPAHRDKAAMNGAQRFMTHDDTDDRATCLQDQELGGLSLKVSQS
jgi:hypothetical protein